ncbi:replication initiation protein [Aliarcobacter cryaerophilus]|uniref:replication initiation protein n=1 Tax=Aliarcobacter cryaerophilus TaxID=28198 RepID=UPI0021B52518|nr:replication initiation protein [Aliarcobacter cryaerophilus]MCT7465423.1 replication initiation protein [Aliarcobacter cryaerophilus]
MKEEDYKVVKHNSLVNIKGKYQYSVNQLKLVCHLIANIKPNEEDFETKYIALKELGFVGENSENYTYFKEEFVRLLEMPFKIPNSKYWVNWFSALAFENGVIEYRFDPALKPFLLNLKENFTSYYLSNVMNLKSNYAILTFELLAQARNQGYRNITIKEYRELLKIPDSYLNADILRLIKKVQKEIRDRTNLQFDFAFKKMGKAFHSINFVVKNNKKVAGVTYEFIENK